MRLISYREAILEALREEMENDSSVFLLGEDIEEPYGGSFKATKGLSPDFSGRVLNTPNSESVIAGMAVGAALTGLRPVAEIMYIDFITLAMDQIVNQAAKLRYMSGGRCKVPLVIRTQCGAGRSSGAQHAQCLESWFMHIPGLYVVMPSTPNDAKGLLKSAIRNDNPVIFIEHKMLYNSKGPVEDGNHLIPLGVAQVKRNGNDVTIVATSSMVGVVSEVADKLNKEGISIEIIDPCTIMPLDKDTIIRSVSKTKHLIIVHEAVQTAGFGAEVAAIIAEEAIDYLDAPIKRVCGKFAPIPFSPKLEREIVPGSKDIELAIRQILS